MTSSNPFSIVRILTIDKDKIDILRSLMGVGSNYLSFFKSFEDGNSNFYFKKMHL